MLPPALAYSESRKRQAPQAHLLCHLIAHYLLYIPCTWVTIVSDMSSTHVVLKEAESKQTQYSKTWITASGSLMVRDTGPLSS